MNCREDDQPFKLTRVDNDSSPQALAQIKPGNPRDPVIRAKFNTCRFADYKESCIALLAKVVTVSVETVAITEAIRAL